MWELSSNRSCVCVKRYVLVTNIYIRIIPPCWVDEDNKIEYNITINILIVGGREHEHIM